MKFRTIRELYQSFDKEKKKAFLELVGFAVLHGLEWDFGDVEIKPPFTEDELRRIRVFLGFAANRMKGE